MPLEKFILGFGMPTNIYESNIAQCATEYATVANKILLQFLHILNVVTYVLHQK